jgi:hypothetical protein
MKQERNSQTKKITVIEFKIIYLRIMVFEMSIQVYISLKLPKKMYHNPGECGGNTH